ncbi:hypothetical protein REPUB_Repub07fG0200200 [Reevesia pubescens]
MPQGTLEVLLVCAKDPICSIPLEPVFMEGNLPPTVYNVVKDEEYFGEIRLGLTFTPEARHTRDLIFKLIRNLLEGGSNLHTGTRPLDISILISVSRTYIRSLISNYVWLNVIAFYSYTLI